MARTLIEKSIFFLLFSFNNDDNVDDVVGGLGGEGGNLGFLLRRHGKRGPPWRASVLFSGFCFIQICIRNNIKCDSSMSNTHWVVFIAQNCHLLIPLNIDYSIKSSHTDIKSIINVSCLSNVYYFSSFQSKYVSSDVEIPDLKLFSSKQKR